jgi:hypothetical protein
MKEKIILFIVILFISCAVQPGNESISSSSGSSSSAPELLNVIYVSTNGSDLKSGYDKTMPILTIQKAVDLAVDGTVIYIARGIYDDAKGLENGVKINKSNIRLLGGWDSNFSLQTGYSDLDRYNIGLIIDITNVSNVIIDGFNIYRNYPGTPFNTGSGIRIMDSSFCTITNCIISNIIVDNTSGGIFMSNCSSCGIHGIIKNNAGNGIKMTYCRSNIINCNITGNNGCGFSANYCSSNTILGSFSYNSSCGIDINRSTNMVISGTINNNSTVNWGGGICIALSQNITVSGAVKNNYTTAYTAGFGGGLHIEESRNCSINADISGNSSVFGGGVFIGGGGNNMIGGNISSNSTASWGAGGGLNIEGSDNNIICGIISSNDSPLGGGLSISGTGNMIINSIFLNNNSTKGVILLDYYSKTNQFISNIIGGTGNGYGFYELDGYTDESQTNYREVSNHTLLYNTFVTNTLSYLYHEQTDGDIGLDEVDLLNTLTNKHDALIVGGNNVTNY